MEQKLFDYDQFDFQHNLISEKNRKIFFCINILDRKEFKTNKNFGRFNTFFFKLLDNFKATDI